MIDGIGRCNKVLNTRKHIIYCTYVILSIIIVHRTPKSYEQNTRFQCYYRQKQTIIAPVHKHMNLARRVILNALSLFKPSAIPKLHFPVLNAFRTF